MASDRIRIVLIDDHRLVTEPLAMRINAEPDLEVVATAADGDTGLQVVLDQQPAIVILDVNVPGRGAFEIAHEIGGRVPSAKILFLTGFLSDILLEQALRLKPTRGYLLKGESADFLISAIRRVAMGETCFSPEVHERLFFRPAEKRYTVQNESRLSELTGRQLEVLRHLANGESVKEVARALHLTEKSVDSHKYRIMHKLGIHDRVGLARYAIREGLLLP